MGVPQIGCACRVCTSADPRDRRRRCGAYVTTDSGAFLIDTPPELREACIAYGVSRVDAVVLTHAHMDHVAGFDDVRRFNTLNGERVPCNPAEPGANGRTFRIVGKPLTCYAMPETEEQMHRIFPYVGAKGGENGLFRPQVVFDNADSFELAGLRIERFRVTHGFPCCGYRLEEGAKGSLAYVSDCHELSDETVERLQGVGVLVLNCLRERQHPTHLSLDRAMGYVRRIGPGKAYFIHMCHDFSHRDWLEKLRGTNVEPAYDGLEVTV